MHWVFKQVKRFRLITKNIKDSHEIHNERSTYLETKIKPEEIANIRTKSHLLSKRTSWNLKLFTSESECYIYHE